MVLPYIDMNPPWVYMCSPSWNPSHFPTHPIPQGHPSAPALSTLSHASNLDWWSISHMVIYMIQCYSLKSSHFHLFPESPKVSSLHLCLFCCLTYRVIVTLSKFHIYALIYCIGVFFLTYFTLYNRLRVRWSGIPISWRIFHSLLWSTQSKALA